MHSDEIENRNDFGTEIKKSKSNSKIIEERAREKYLEQVSDIKERIKQIGGEAGEKAKQIIDNTGEYIKENPQKSALIGLSVGIGIGVLIGLLIRRK